MNQTIRTILVRFVQGHLGSEAKRVISESPHLPPSCQALQQEMQKEHGVIVRPDEFESIVREAVS